MEKSVKMDKLTLGVCYYPEHWDKSFWRSDIERMKEYGIEVVRIAEFAWSKFEPHEGEFTFEFFDSFMELCLELDMKVIFCTPTATPPAWLSKKYPEILNARIDGALYNHGSRRHYNYNSPKYRELSAVITEKLAGHYCPHPMVIGWQIDNEFNCGIDKFYSEADHAAFREYMKDRFGTLDNLNDKMGTVFWNQAYASWDEIHLARLTQHGDNNQHMSLEEKRFISESAIAYCKLQSDVIRKYLAPGQFITTNGIFPTIDYHKLMELSLDFITFDSYPNFAFGYSANPRKKGALNDRSVGRRLSVTRSISPNFGIMEQQAGSGGSYWGMKQPMPKPGQIRLWAWQSIAHGADFVSFFRWRTCGVGTEIYWHGLNDYSNLPNRRLEELKKLCKEIASLGGLAGSKYKARIAMVRDYSNEWDSSMDIWRGFDEISEWGWLEAAQFAHAPLDYLYLPEGKKPDLGSLSQYPLLVYPHACILTEETAGVLDEYVRGGGTLLMGCRTGYKDEYGRCPVRPMPGAAEGLCGVRVKDYTWLGPADETEYAVWEGESIEAPDFNEILEPAGGAEVLAAFKGNYYDGEPALTVRSAGKGKAYYFGAAFSTNAASAFLRKLGEAEPYSSILELPPELELAVREKDEKRYYFILNYLKDEMHLSVKKEMKDLITGKNLKGEAIIEAYGVMILEESPPCEK